MGEVNLFCNECGEKASIVHIARVSGCVVVSCKRDGVICCQTRKCTTEDEAVKRWEGMQGER